MLVLSRQKDETIMIGDDVEITVVDIRGDKVRIGITAPPHIPVHRKEVYEAIKRENRAAAQVKPEDISGASSKPAPGPDEGKSPKPPGKTQPVVHTNNRNRSRHRRDNGRAADSHKRNNGQGNSVGSDPEREGTPSVNQ